MRTLVRFPGRENIFNLNLFLRGNEPNGEQQDEGQQEQQQLK